MLFVVALPPLFFCSFQAAAAADPEGDPAGGGRRGNQAARPGELLTNISIQIHKKARINP